MLVMSLPKSLLYYLLLRLINLLTPSRTALSDLA